jgi:peptidoglycan/xylan/chitin deacetylase (PgdA/CDA1 family)
MRRLTRVSWLRFTAALALACVCTCSGTTTTAAAKQERVAYITFDDGPSPVWTPRILDILQREHVRATFFVLGFRSEKYPWLVRRIHKEGHEIGNHGYYHTYIVHQNQRWVQAEVRRADAAIEAACGVKPMYFRPPGGILNAANLQAVRKMGHPIAMWTVDTNDWKATSAASIIGTIRRDVKPGAIILMHDGIDSSSRYTVKALPSVIHYLRQAGYSLQVLPEHYRGNRLGVPTAPTRYPASKAHRRTSPQH